MATYSSNTTIKINGYMTDSAWIPVSGSSTKVVYTVPAGSAYDFSLWKMTTTNTTNITLQIKNSAGIVLYSSTAEGNPNLKLPEGAQICIQNTAISANGVLIAGILYTNSP